MRPKSRTALASNFACGTSVRVVTYTNPDQGLLMLIPNWMATPEVCPVCLEPIDRPTALDSCEHKFCRPCITEWCKNSTSCPLCRSPISLLKDPVTGVSTHVAPVVQRSDHEHTWIPSFEVFAQQRRLPRTNPAPDPEIHGSSSNESGSEHPSGSLNYPDSSASSASSGGSDKSESSDSSYVSNDRDYSPKPRRRN